MQNRIARSRLSATIFNSIFVLGLLTSCGSPATGYREVARVDNIRIITPRSEEEVEGTLVSALSREKTDEIVAAIKKFKESYPDRLIDNYLHEICVGERCTFSATGAPVGGEFMPEFPRRIFLSAEHGTYDSYVRTLHHEFAHLLELASTDEFRQTWMQLSTYSNEEYSEYLKSEKSEGTEADFERGFYSSYAARNYDEDFAETAEMLFTGKTPWENLDRYPILKRKVELTMEFYRMIDPELTAEFFQTRQG